MIPRLNLFGLALLFVPLHAVAEQPPPIIDMHVHASTADENGPPPLGLCVPLIPHLPALDPKRSWEEVFIGAFKKPSCSDPIWSPMTDEAVMQQTLAALERRNMIGVLSGPPERVVRWSEAAPGRFIASVQFRLGRDELSPDALRQLFAKGPFGVFGEVSNQYAGIAPDDERMEPYWTVAEELDVPVAIHLGAGPPGAPYLGFPKMRVRLGNPLLLEEVLVRHPRMRVSVMHYGHQALDEMIALLENHPQVHVDIGGIQWLYPPKYFYSQLQRLFDAGFGKRVMFGSDQMNWPGVIEPAIAIIEKAPFLTREQKRDVFYNNAARFLRLSEEEIAQHHGK